jgi:ribosomal protein S18 acetylase RimI-like enzyme
MIVATIRHARLPDIPRLVELRRRFKIEEDNEDGARERPGYAEDCRKFYTRAVETDGWFVWVAEAGREIVSNATVVLIDKVPHPFTERSRIAYLTNVYTVPDFRGQGIAGRILAKAQESARAADVELVIVWPSERSVSLYKRQGFEVQDEPLVWDATP